MAFSLSVCRPKTVVENPRGPVALKSGRAARSPRSARLQVHDERKSALSDVTAHVPHSSSSRRKAPLQGFPAETLRRYVFHEVRAMQRGRRSLFCFKTVKQ